MFGAKVQPRGDVDIWSKPEFECGLSVLDGNLRLEKPELPLNPFVVTPGDGPIYFEGRGEDCLFCDTI